MRGLKYEPVVYLFALNSAVVLLVAYGLPLTATQTAAVTTIATAILAGVAAVLTRPVEVSAITGALTTAVTAAGAFGLHLSADRIGALTTVINLVLALVLRQNVSPSIPPPAVTLPPAKLGGALPD